MPTERNYNKAVEYIRIQTEKASLDGEYDR